MSALIVIGGIFGYLFGAGSIAYFMTEVVDADNEVDDNEAAWFFALLWPVSIPLTIVGGVIALVVMSPFLIGDTVKDRRTAKASRAADAAREIASVRAENARLERELGIGGQS